MKTTSFLLASAAWLLLAGVALAGDHGKTEGGARLYGTIEAMPANGHEGSWAIGGKEVNVYKKTEISEKHGRAAIGRYVEVKGEQIGDKFAALSIEVEKNGRSDSGATPAKFYGTVEAMPKNGVLGTWRVNGRDLVVTGNTRIKEKHGAASVGSYVEVKGDFSAKTFTASAIEVKDDRDHNSHKAYNSIFSGKIESMPQGGYHGRWVVAGHQVEVSDKTLIDEAGGKASPGSGVRVRGVRTGNTITATEMKTTANR